MRHLVVAMLLLMGCAAAGSNTSETPQPTRPRVYEGGGTSDAVLGRNDVTTRTSSITAPVGIVWPLALQAYRELGMRVDVVNQDGHQASTNHLNVSRRMGSARPSRYFECGGGLTGDIADEWQLDVNADLAGCYRQRKIASAAP